MSKPGGSNGHDHSFADVLNSLNGESRRTPGPRGAAEQPPAGHVTISWLPAATRPATEQVNWQDAYTGYEAGDQASPAAEEWGEPEDFASAVRPYTWTRGRTRPVYDLAVETLVSTSAQGREVAALTSVEHRAVAELCRQPRSVAEVAALLLLPLGVARVLLADMANIGLVVVHRTATNSGEVPESGFMERVLSGLRRL